MRYLKEEEIEKTSLAFDSAGSLGSEHRKARG